MSIDPCEVLREAGASIGAKPRLSEAEGFPRKGCRIRPRGLEARGGTETSLGTKDGGVGTCRAMGNADEPSPRLPGARGVPAWHFTATNRSLDRVPGARRDRRGRQTSHGRMPKAPGPAAPAAPGAGVAPARDAAGASPARATGHQCINNTDKKIRFHFPEEKGRAKDKRGRLPSVWQPRENCYPDKKITD